MLVKAPHIFRLRSRWFWLGIVALLLVLNSNMPFLSCKLPAYTGPYDVGAIDIEVPCEERIIGDAVFKSTGEPALKLQTVFFTLYYPAAASTTTAVPRPRHHPWVPRPLSLHAGGYARLANVENPVIHRIFSFFLWLLVGATDIPATVEAPLLDAATSSSSTDDARTTRSSLPVVVFSHGMAGMRNSYSQWCGELASRGVVVAAIEHRDGSGPGSAVWLADGQREDVTHLRLKDIRHADARTPFVLGAIKEQQLAFRAAEVEETVRVLRLLAAGKGDLVAEENTRKEGVGELAEFKDRLDVAHITMAGHSYGATLALRALRAGPSDALPLTSALVLDPGKASGPLNDDVHVPTLIIHSGSWSRGTPKHFQRVKEVAEAVLRRGKSAWFVTLQDTAHPSCTDAPLIEPYIMDFFTGAKMKGKMALREYVHASVNFLQFAHGGEERGVLTKAVTHPDGIEATEGKTIEAQPELDRWAVHVAPASRSR